MRCYPNYRPQQYIPLGRTNSRCVYEDQSITSKEYQDRIIQYKIDVNNKQNIQTTTNNTRYSYLVTNPPKIYGTQTDVYTNPNTLGNVRVGQSLISLNNNPTCTNIYPIDNPAAFPVNQPSVIYPVLPPLPPPVEECENYTAMDGGILVIPTCIP
jgi:hypothetical protein